MNRWLLLVLLLWWAPSASAAGAPLNIAAIYSRANEDFIRGDYSSSARLLNQILKRYPEHHPSLLLMGRALYRLGKSQLAVRYFRAFGTEPLPPDAAFDYGVAFFAVNSCKHAIAGFGVVPLQSPYRDLASFYSGVCYYRARQWQPAESSLRAANRLPSNLAATRRKMLYEISQRRYNRYDTGYSAASAYAVPAPVYQSAIVAPPSKDKKDKSGSDKTADKGGTDKGSTVAKQGGSVTITPSVTYKKKAVHLDYGGAQYDNSTEQGVSTDIDAELRYDFGQKGNGPQTSLTMGADFWGVNKDTQGNTIQFTSSEWDTDALLPTPVSQTSANVRYATVKLTPGFQVAFDSWSIQPVMEYYQEIPQYTQVSQHSGFYGPNLTITGSSGNWSGNLNLMLLTYQDPDTNPLGVNREIISKITRTLDPASISFTAATVNTSDPGSDLLRTTDSDDAYSSTGGFASSTTFILQGTRPFEYFNVDLQLRDVINTPPPDTDVDGSTNETGIKVSVDHPIEDFASLAVNASYSLLSGYEKTGLIPAGADPLAPTQTAAGSGTKTTYGVVAKLTPADWITAQVSYTHKQTVYSLTSGDPVAFRAAVPDLSTEYIISINLSKSF